MPIHDETANDKEDQKQNRNRSRQNMSMSGKVFMTYTNYKINKGIPDSFFEEKKN
jgi:outer membrane lipoprotein-sorting protein